MAVNSANNAYTGYKNFAVKKTEKTEKEEKATELSDNAKKYLEGLKDKFKNVDFIVKDFSTDEEADKYLRSGNGEYNCVITPDLLEKMAADEETAAKYEDIIASAGGQFDTMKEELGENAEYVESYGISVDSSGKVSYHVLLKDGLKSLNDTAAKIAEQRAERKESAEKNNNSPRGPDKNKSIRFEGDSIDELIKKINDYIEGKEDDTNKDSFVKENDKIWENVNGKKDGFDPFEKNQDENYFEKPKNHYYNKNDFKKAQSGKL